PICTCRYGFIPPVSSSSTNRSACSRPASTTSPTLVRKVSTWFSPSPVTASSTARKCASATRMPTFSAGVTRYVLPSSSLRSTEENSCTSGILPIGVPRYHQLPSERISMSRSPQNGGFQRSTGGAPLPARAARAISDDSAPAPPAPASPVGSSMLNALFPCPWSRNSHCRQDCQQQERI